MLDKTEYYHGAAIVRLMEDARCKCVRKLDHLGYLINEDVFAFLKYTTKSRTPWGFTFDKEDVERCIKMAQQYKKVVIALVCGSDGVCALDWNEAHRLLDSKAGRIAMERKHNESYAVWGTEGELKGKIPVNRWPTIVFET